MDFPSFSAWRQKFLQTHPDAIDFGETNLYRSLPAAFSERISPIFESVNPKAKHRCHVAEEFIEVLGLPPEIKAFSSISRGVRDSLGIIFAHAAANGKRVVLPSDVYPAYLRLANDAGIRFVTYESQQGIPFDKMTDGDTLLVCEPSKPWGTCIADDDFSALSKWTRQRDDNVLLIDAVYQPVPDARWKDEIVNGNVWWLTSLSKGWLLPEHVGIAIFSERHPPELRQAFSSRDKFETLLRKGFSALTNYRDRPHLVGDILAELRNEFQDKIESWWNIKSINGYFAVSETDHDTFAQNGIVAIPASVFGTTNSKLSILSTLPTKWQYI